MSRDPEPRCRTSRPRGAARLACVALCGATLCGATLCWATPCAASPFSATLFGLYGKTWAGGNPADPFGPGIGLQASFALPASLYVAASYQLFFGVEVNESLLSDPVIRLDRTGSQNRLLGYFGYDWDLASVRLRPSLGLGYSAETIETERSSEGQPTTQTSSSSSGLVLSPGIELRVPLGTLSLCAELRSDTVVLDGTDPSAVVVGVGLGLEIDP